MLDGAFGAMTTMPPATAAAAVLFDVGRALAAAFALATLPLTVEPSIVEDAVDHCEAGALCAAAFEAGQPERFAPCCR